MTAFLRRHRLVWTLAALAALFLAGVGAFGSGAAAPAPRLAYWTLVMMGGGVIVSLAIDLFHARGWLGERPWIEGALLSLLIAVPQTLLVWAVTNWMFDDPWRIDRIPPLYPSVLLVAAAFVALQFLLGRQPAFTQGPSTSGEARPTFLDRLPPRLHGAELYAVEAEDHYLRLHTSRGSDLIAMRLADALVELERIEGARVHRSWWVARDAVERGAPRRGRAVLTLKGGLNAPVSRTYAASLRRAHWF